MNSEAVIFIPGIKGTKLVETNRVDWDTIWSGIQSNIETIEDLELTGSYENQFYEENINSIIAPGEIEKLAYGEFIRDLKTNKPIFIFNYDWRMSAQENGRKLRQFMDYLIAKSKARTDNSLRIKRFDFITHSLGNSILRNVLHEEGMSRINKIVFTVPPFKGALDIVSLAIVGEGFFDGVKAKIRKFIRTMPGALELLPSYQKASFYYPSRQHSFFSFSKWQSNIINSPTRIPAKFKKALKLANQTVTSKLCDLSTLSDAERRRILVLVRHGFDTWQSIPIKEEDEDVENFVDFESGLKTDDGDGRVPHVSSCTYFDSIQTLIFKDALFYRDYKHGFFLKDERVQKIVNRFLFKPNQFSYHIPGGSIERVTGLEEHSSNGRPYWTVKP